MPFPGLNQFKANLQDGGARASKFDVEIAFPGAIGVPAQGVIRFHCKIAHIPGATINVIEQKYMGRTLKYAGSRNFNNLSVTIINDEGFTVRRALEAWQGLINSHESNIAGALAPNGVTGYGRTGIVKQYSKNGDLIRRYRCVEMWPSNLGDISLDWGNEDAIEEYTVDFAYQWWEPEVNFSIPDPTVAL